MNTLPFFEDKPRLFEVVDQTCFCPVWNLQRKIEILCFLAFWSLIAQPIIPLRTLQGTHYSENVSWMGCSVFTSEVGSHSDLRYSSMSLCHTLQEVLATGSCSLKSLRSFLPTHLPGTVISLSRRGCSSSTRNLKRADLTPSPYAQL